MAVKGCHTPPTQSNQQVVKMSPLCNWVAISCLPCIVMLKSDAMLEFGTMLESGIVLEFDLAF